MTAVCVTHGDVDGMTCAAQILRREEGNCEIVYSNARYLPATLKRVSLSEPRPDRLYITDLPASEASFRVAASIVSQGTEVLWVDHHDWPDGLLSRMSEVGVSAIYRCGLDTPAGVLLGTYLSCEDSYCEQIGRICYASAHGTTWEREWFMRLSSSVGDCTRDVLERLAGNLPFTVEDREAIDLSIQREAMADEVLARPPLIETTGQHRLMAVYDTSGSPRLYLGKKVFARHDLRLCLHRISSTKWQLATAPGERIDMTSLVSKAHDIDSQLHIGGRSHELLAIEFRGGDMPDNMHERVVEFIKSTL